MLLLMRIASVAYLVLLTSLLLTADPARLIGCGGGLPAWLGALAPGAHLLSFAVLAVLALGARGTIPRWGMILALALYGGLTEIAQGFLPPRTSEWNDWFQDLGGIALGTAFCAGVALLAGAWAAKRRRKHGLDQVV